jgi:hypothetical protein
MPEPARPFRIRVPLFMDLVVVSDPVQIKDIDESGDVDRLHAFPTRSLPLWVRFFFRATKFHDDRRDLWFCPFESASNSTYPGRRDYLVKKVAEGYTPEDVRNIADLLISGADDAAVSQAMVQVVNRRFFGREIPPDITAAAKNTLQTLPEALAPWKYLRAIRSREKILEFCERNVEPGVHILDVGHNIGEVVQASTTALRHLNDNLDRPIEDTFTRYAPTAQVPRIAIRASRLGGLLRSPTVPGKTVVILKVAKAAATSGDLYYTFGTGKSQRACVFMGFFVEFMKDLQAELGRRRGRSTAPGA